MSDPANRNGMALATALIAIVLIGALIAGTFFVTTQDYRVARNSLSAPRALSAAEYGQNMLLNDWQSSWNQSMKTGDTLKRVYSAGSGTTDTVVMTRLRFNMFWVVSTGRIGFDKSSDARRRTGLLIRLDTPEMPFPGAFSGAKDITVTGSSTGSGTDTIPAGWTDCPPAGPTKAAVASASTSNVTTAGSCSGASCLSGSPKILGTPDVADSMKVLDGWAELVAQANIVIDQGTAGSINGMAPAYNADGSCNMSLSTNWGDPGRAATPGKCEDYFPIIYLKSTGALGALGPTNNVNGGIGQGILLVEANIKLNGNFTFAGPIIVRGNVETSGNGNKTIGGIQALNQNCASNCNKLSGNSDLTYSSCTISKIFALKAKPTVAKHHSWADMY